MKDRVAHLNLVLRAIRRVNELITREKDPDRLLQGICDNLIENRGYHNAWIALLDQDGKFIKALHAGMETDFMKLADQFQQGKLTHCGHLALKNKDVVHTADPRLTCPGCPLAQHYRSRGAMTVRLAHDQRTYGFLSVSIPRELARDKEEQALFREVADDIGFALHGIEVEKAHNEAVVALKESEEKFRKISSSAQDAIIMMDSGGHISFWNQAAEKVFGYTQTEALGRELHLWLAPERYRKHYQHGVNTFRSSGDGAVIGQTLELAALRKNGEEFPIELSVSSVRLKGQWNAIGILRDISERKRVEKKLIEAKETAEATTSAKSEFLAKMSHEIRTPMNGVIAATDLALGETLSPKLEHYLKIISASAYSLLGIINDILDFSKIEAGKLDLESRPFALFHVMDRVTKLFATKAGNKDIELLVDLDPQTPRHLIGDPLRLQQILKNLVDNAVKFTQPGGTVVIGTHPPALSPEGAQLTFFVRDTGVGIAPEYIPKLFEPFSQADASPARKYEGAGLGLSICRQLLELLGGTIQVESRLAEGSTFTFSLPFGRQPAGSKPWYIPPEKVQGLTVLVVDDCMTTCAVVKKMLESFGFTVETVASGQASLTRLEDNASRATPFDLVIMDWRMPKMNGIETARKIRSDLKLSIPIILITAFGGENERQDSQQAGINGFLAKPIYPSTLFNAIMDVFGKQGVYEGPLQATVTPMPSVAKSRLGGCRVLVVEDNPTNQQVAQAVLEEAGVHVDMADNGKDALEKIEHRPYDAVLMDIQMPQMDGLEATRRIRQDDRFATLPIIAMTAHAMKGDDERCLAAGMNDYIAKPIKQDRLFRVLWKAIERRRGTRASTAQSADNLQEKIAPAVQTPANVLLPEALPGIDIRGALSNLCIEPDVFQRILSGFARDNRNTHAQIKSLTEQKEWKTLQHLAHRLNGIAANIGAQGLQAAAQAVEVQCRTQKTPEASAIHHLETALQQVLQSLQLLSTPLQTLSADKPATLIDPKQLRSLLEKLGKALEMADPEAIETHLQAVGQHLDSTEFQTLANQIATYDYDNALATLSTILTAVADSLS